MKVKDAKKFVPYEFDIVNHAEDKEDAIREINTGQVVVIMNGYKIHISVEDEQIKIYKTDSIAVHSIVVKPVASNVILVS